MPAFKSTYSGKFVGREPNTGETQNDFEAGSGSNVDSFKDIKKLYMEESEEKWIR